MVRENGAQYTQKPWAVLREYQMKRAEKTHDEDRDGHVADEARGLQVGVTHVLHELLDGVAGGHEQGTHRYGGTRAA
jgi:hypothetical protein